MKELTDRYTKLGTDPFLQNKLTVAYVITEINGQYKYWSCATHESLPCYGLCFEPSWRTTAEVLNERPRKRYRIMSTQKEGWRNLPILTATTHYRHARAIVKSLNDIKEISDHLLRQMDDIAEMYG